MPKTRFRLRAFLLASPTYRLIAAISSLGAIGGTAGSVTTLGAVALTTAACVTVNVNFPESAVQKATDDYVRDLYRAKNKDTNKAPASATDTPIKKSTSAVSLALISEAYADDYFKVKSDKADEIQKHLAAHLDEVLAQKRNGNLGETNEGLLVVKGSKIPPLLQKKVSSVVDEENRDREALYNEVLRINGLGRDRLSAIQKSFSRSFQAESPSGTWVQDSSGTWSQKP